jgi:hypothetical protein
MFNVHLRINDADTLQPTPVRLRISDGDGRVFPPLGHVAEFAFGRNEDVGGHLLLGRERWYYIDGTCEVPLPGGIPLTIEAAKGLEYEPVRQTVTLGAGQMSLRFAIKRWTNPNSNGWYAGDTRCHFLTPHSALLEGMAEGVPFVNLLATKALIPSQNGKLYESISNMLAFSGQEPALETGETFVSVNTYNSHPLLGGLALLHCHRAVFPLTFGGADATDDWSLADWCDQCHRKKGFVVWCDPFHMESPFAPEALADLIMGRIDAVECTPTTARVREWYRAWSAGIRFPLVGASAKESNRTALGSMRTYARMQSDQGFEPAGWIEAARAGRTFVTSGPMLSFTVDDQDPGALIEHAAAGRKVNIRARIESLRVLESPLEILVNGDVLERIRQRPDVEPAVASVEREYTVDRPSWIAARCVDSSRRDSFAHSSPIFVRVEGRMPTDTEVVRHYNDWLGRTVDWVDRDGRFEIPRRKEQLRALLEQARQALLARVAGG